MDYCIEKIEAVLESKLLEISKTLGGKELSILDIGVFPWHTKLEFSFLFSHDDIEEDDIASWPHYDFTDMSEGQWEEGKEIARDINAIWEESFDAFPIFLDFASAATSEKVNNVLKKFNLAPDFKVQVLDSDNSDSPNYCEGM